MTTPGGTRAIVATKDFMWAETDRGNFTCSQPCQNGNWTAPTPKRMDLSGKPTQFALTGTGGKLTGTPSRFSLSGALAPSGQTIKLTSASARRA
jgi:hypothetical protein